MIKVFIVAVVLFLSRSVHAELSEQQIRVMASNVVNQTISDSKLKGAYEATARKYLNGVMLNNKMIANMLILAKEAKIDSDAEAKEWGFNLLLTIRNNSILKLSSKDQFELLMVNTLIIAKMSDYECAQYFRKKRTDENGKGRPIFEIAMNLEIGVFKKYIEGYEKAFMLLVNNRDESTKLSGDELGKIKFEFGQLFTALNKEKPFISEFFRSGKSFSTGVDSDVCKIGSSLLDLIVGGDRGMAQKRTSAYLNSQLF